jgi:hypothetical protein
MALSHRRTVVVVGSMKGLKEIDIDLLGPLYYF